MKIASWAIAIAVVLCPGCGSTPQVGPEPAAQPDAVTIRLASGDPAEQRTEQQLNRLIGDYDLSAWTFTREIVIDRRVFPPHSHPVLTLNTRHLRDDELLLSTYLHEQIHWFVSDRSDALDRAVQDLRQQFPGAPSGPPGGARNEQSTYLHIVVGYLELIALRRTLGEFKARQVLEFWANDHYTWIYRLILDRENEIRPIVRKHQLFPPGI